MISITFDMRICVTVLYTSMRIIVPARAPGEFIGKSKKDVGSLVVRSKDF